MQSTSKTRVLTQFSILLAIEAVFCFTPLGSIPIGPMVATVAHIPVIVTAILLGTKPGAVMGFFMGLFSFIVWTFMPPPTSAVLAFVFTPFYSAGDFHGNGWSLVICFVPRILIGVSAGAVYSLLSKKNGVLACSLAGILGSLTTTVLVLGGIYLFFGNPYAAAAGLEYSALLSAIALVAATNGLLEAAIAAVAAAAICLPIKRVLQKSSI